MSDNERKIRVLLVDDEDDLVSLMSTRLEKRHFETAATTSGGEAVTLCQTRHFDVAIIDLKMPGMDGVEVMQKLKVMQPYLQTIMCTGHGSTESALEAGKLDAFRYVMKPCDFEELVEHVMDAYRHRREMLKEIYERELQDTIEHCMTAQDILEHSEALRRKYEQD